MTSFVAFWKEVEDLGRYGVWAGVLWILEGAEQKYKLIFIEASAKVPLFA